MKHNDMSDVEETNTKEIDEIMRKVEGELQKARQDWLRSEIETLEGMKTDQLKDERINDYHDGDVYTDREMDEYYNQALTTVITRYKEELLELENQK